MKDEKFMTELRRKDERSIRRYLLGELPESERTPMEMRLLSDAALYEHLRLVEGELVDDYVRGGLSARERRQFEQHFLCTEERRRMVKFAGALRRYALARPVTQSVAGGRPSPLAALWRAAFSFNGALAGAAVVLLAVFSFLLVRQMNLRQNLEGLRAEAPAAATAPASEEELAAERRRQEALAAEQRRVEAERQRALEQLAEREARPAPEQGPAASPAPRLALTLSPIRTRDAGPTNTLRLRPGERAVRLRLEFWKDDYSLYTARLEGPQAARQFDNLRARVAGDTKFIILTLPAAGLPEGDYVLRLRSAGRPAEDLATYYFRLVAP